MDVFKFESKDQIGIITCPAEISSGTIKELGLLAEKILGETVKAHVFDFSSCTYLDPGSYRIFIRLKQQANTTGVQVFCVNLSRDLLRQIQSSGLDMVFNPMPNLNSVFTKVGLKKSSSATSPESIEFIKPFISAVQVAINTQANTPLTGGKPFAKQKKYDVDIAIAGVINLVSDQFVGSISLLFPAPVFLEIYANMLGETITTITKESEDAAAELLNIIFGLAKMKLNNEKGYSVQKAIPTVLVGDKLQTASSNIGSTLVLPFTTKTGSFFVEVVFEQAG